MFYMPQGKKTVIIDILLCDAGLLLEPGKRYTKVVDSPFHISAAVLDTTTQDHGIVRVSGTEKNEITGVVTL